MTSSDMQPQQKKTPEQIEAEITHTRAAISEDIRALGNKLSPENLKQEAKSVLRDAKEEATDMLREAKDHAIDSVTETVHELSDRARRAGSMTTEFVSTHAVPLSLIGIGAGWFMLSLRHERRLGSDMAHRVSEQATELTHDAREQVRRASIATRDFAEANPLALGALAVAAGVGVGMLLPSTPPERRLMGASSDRVRREARQTAQTVGRVAKDAVGDIKNAISDAPH